MTHDQIREIINVHDSGGAIERKSFGMDWEFADLGADPMYPRFDFSRFQYRIKPKPPKPEEFWLRFCTSEDSKHQWTVHRSKPDNDFLKCNTVHVREVLE